MADSWVAHLVYGEPRRRSHKIPSGEPCADYWKAGRLSDVRSRAERPSEPKENCMASVARTGSPGVSARRSDDPLLRPLEIKTLRLRNRIMSTSHASALDDDGLPKERYQRYHEEKAKGGLALTMFGGSSMVDADSSWGGGQLYVGSDAIIPYFQAFSERIHRQGAALMCQISHLGRRADATAMNWMPALGPSRVRETQHRSIPKEMDRADIERVVKAYGQAARRCKEGGL